MASLFRGGAVKAETGARGLDCKVLLSEVVGLVALRVEELKLFIQYFDFFAVFLLQLPVFFDYLLLLLCFRNPGN